MKRFEWRLQKVLDVKTKEEQFKRMELVRLTEALAIKRSELLMRRRILQEIAAQIARDRSRGRLEAQEFFLRNADADDRIIRTLRAEVEKLDTQRTQKTAEVLAAKRFREGLEKLRTEAKARFIEEQEKIEQKEMDDRTTVAFARNESIRS
ncbi:MAG: flagellar FliJ family protein [Sedimentisphaerales bacterium]|jgi:flagellar biosynthesis chaperone FliJ|nr:flagellar FliJ family protein [Planctomycetota bacterium]MDY0355164.1 flagellar FliJ family protein [Sedimentisphaerales bacterium]